MAKGDAGAVALIVALFVGVFAAFTLLWGWVLMLVIGAVHNSVWADLPAFGFWQSVLITLALSVIGAFFRGSDSVSSK